MADSKPKIETFIFKASRDGGWRRFYRGRRLNHLADDPRFRKKSGNTERRSKAENLFPESLQQKTAVEWLSTLVEAKQPCAPINTPDRVSRDPHASAKGINTEVTPPTMATATMLGMPVRYDEKPATIRLPPSWEGEHGNEILDKRFGYNDRDPLKKEGAV